MYQPSSYMHDFAWSIFPLLARFYAGRKRPAGAEDVVLVEGTRGEVAKRGRTTTSRGRGSSMSGKSTTGSKATTTTIVATLRITDENQPGTAGETAARRWRKAYPTLGQELSYSQDPAWHNASYYPGIEYFTSLRSTGVCLTGKGTIPTCARASTDDKGGIGDRGIVGRRGPPLILLIVVFRFWVRITGCCSCARMVQQRSGGRCGSYMLGVLIPACKDFTQGIRRCWMLGEKRTSSNWSSGSGCCCLLFVVTVRTRWAITG
ncbi:hypothetical protein EV426DRAFT_129354 [Tirmania nivea]|nr:hypothetical protein EV426DRAFT_129354 [Tirmania nivea]